MRELVYSDKSTEDLIKEHFPTAVIKDASDEIHHERFEVYIGDITDDEFHEWAVKHAIALSCLGFQLLIDTDKEFRQKVKLWLKEAEKDVAEIRKEMKEDSNDKA